MIVTRMTVPAATLAAEVADTDSAPLAQRDCPALPIVAVSPSGKIEIIDGFHRIAGMIAAGETDIVCLTCDDLDVLGDAANAENPKKQAAALSAIYKAHNQEHNQ